MSTDVNWAEHRERGLAGFTATSLPPTMKLPALPLAVTRFVEKSANPNVSIKVLANIVETDTGLTMELLRHVNSSYVGLRHKARSVQQALSLLGVRQSKTFLVTAGMQAAVRSRKSKLMNQSAFWNASLQKALFAKAVAGLLQTDGDVAFAGALLQDFLIPVVTNELFDGYLLFIQERDRLPDSLCEFERTAFGWDHATAAASLAHRWHLPDDLVCCVMYHHHGLQLLADPELRRTPVAAVALSALLPDQLRQERLGISLLRHLGSKWPAFDLDEIVEAVDAQHSELGMGVQNDFPLGVRCKTDVPLTANVFNDGTIRETALAS